MTYQLGTSSLFTRTLANLYSAMSQGYDKDAARKRRGEKRRLKRRSAAIKQAQA